MAPKTPTTGHQGNVLCLRLADAASMLGLSPNMLRKLTYPRGPIRAKRAGRAVLYPVEELQRWLRER